MIFMPHFRSEKCQGFPDVLEKAMFISRGAKNLENSPDVIHLIRDPKASPVSSPVSACITLLACEIPARRISGFFLLRQKFS